MSGAFAAGNAPCCSECKPRTRSDCDYAAGSIDCTPLAEVNVYAVFAAQVADLICGLPTDTFLDQATAEGIADGFASVLDDVLPSGWVDSDDFCSDCGFPVKKSLAEIEARIEAAS